MFNYAVDTTQDQTRTITLSIPFKPFVDTCKETTPFDRDDVINLLNTINYLYLNRWEYQVADVELLTSALIEDIFMDDSELVDVNEVLLLNHRLIEFTKAHLTQQNYQLPPFKVVGVNYEDQGLAAEIEQFSITLQEVK